MGFDLNVLAALIIVITIHEFSHAAAAYFFGDPTAKINGRLSLNPLRHLDVMGTLMMLLIHIGWGKPVPVNPRFFRNPKRDEALVALAGPVSNIVLALLLAVPLKYLGDFVSILLFAFNILPFPPLDGSKFVGLMIPRRYEAAYQRYLNGGMVYFMLFLAFDQFILSRILGFSVLSYFMGIIFTLVKSIIFLGT
jgi:Zn-dependent protease